MDPAEQRLFQQKVDELDTAVTCLVTAAPNQCAEFERTISTQQQFQERPWVSHFVPHINIIRERLKDFRHSTSVTPASQPAPQSVRVGIMSLQPACSNPVPEKTQPMMDLFSYFQSKVKIPVYSEPDSDDDPYLGIPVWLLEDLVGLVLRTLSWIVLQLLPVFL